MFCCRLFLCFAAPRVVVVQTSPLALRRCRSRSCHQSGLVVYRPDECLDASVATAPRRYDCAWRCAPCRSMAPLVKGVGMKALNSTNACHSLGSSLNSLGTTRAQSFVAYKGVSTQESFRNILTSSYVCVYVDTHVVSTGGGWSLAHLRTGRSEATQKATFLNLKREATPVYAASISVVNIKHVRWEVVFHNVRSRSIILQ